MAEGRKPAVKAQAAAAAEQIVSEALPDAGQIAEAVSDVVGAVYATVHLLPNFEPGDRLDGRLDPLVIQGLLARGEAARTKPSS